MYGVAKHSINRTERTSTKMKGTEAGLGNAPSYVL
jgi:hypothetical protein